MEKGYNGTVFKTSNPHDKCSVNQWDADEACRWLPFLIMFLSGPVPAIRSGFQKVKKTGASLPDGKVAPGWGEWYAASMLVTGAVPAAMAGHAHGLQVAVEEVHAAFVFTDQF